MHVFQGVRTQIYVFLYVSLCVRVHRLHMNHMNCPIKIWPWNMHDCLCRLSEHALCLNIRRERNIIWDGRNSVGLCLLHKGCWSWQSWPSRHPFQSVHSSVICGWWDCCCLVVVTVDWLNAWTCPVQHRQRRRHASCVLVCWQDAKAACTCGCASLCTRKWRE